MNNCRAGLYSFASTTAWLHATGMASPPLLVMLGLTLPDSRMLSGVASIGLTLANIAIILPHLRQPILDNVHAVEDALAHEPSKEQIKLSQDESYTAYLTDPVMEGPVVASGLPFRRDPPSPSFTCSSTVKSVRTSNMEPLWCQNIESEVAPQTILPQIAGKTDHEVPFDLPSSLYANFSERKIGSSNLFSRKGRDALCTPLPAPDSEEVAFFDTEDAIFSNSDPDDALEQYIGPEGCSAIGDYETTAEEEDRIAASSAQDRVELGENFTETAFPVVRENVASLPTNVTVPDCLGPFAKRTISDLPHSSQLPALGVTAQSAHTTNSLALAKSRPESLEFIPQSVIRRYPSAPMVLATRTFGHQAFCSGHERQVLPAPPLMFVHNPAILLKGARPRASYATLPGDWRTSFVAEIQPTRRWNQDLAIETGPALAQGPPSPSEPPPEPEPTPRKKSPTHKRRLRVLAHAALRNCRATIRRRKNDGDDGSFTSDSDSDSDDSSQYSSGSSAHESMLPHMLGADLIAAIDANSESGLNLVGSKTKMRTPLHVYEEFLIPADSEMGVSIVMQMSSHDDASDGEVGAPASRSLTYEDIQQWASGVVQKCVRQVCHNRVPGEPSTPSQASDVCAERPSGSGASQCPLAGLHCKLGTGEIPAPRIKEVCAVPLPISTLPRKPFQARNLRDIPEFVPRQRQVSTTGRVEAPQQLGMRSSMDATREAATRVIARMEDRVRFNTRQWLAGTGEKRMVNTAGGRQGTLRCA